MITRRSFLAAAAAAAFGDRSSPETFDISRTLRRAVDCILHRIDYSAGGRPWFAVDVKDHRPVRLRHDTWDFGDTTGRFLEALVLARQIVPAGHRALAAESRMRKYLDSLFDTSDLVWNPDTKSVDHMFAQGSALYALVTDYQQSGDVRIRTRIERMIAALDRAAVHEKDYLWFPQVATKKAPCSHMAAYQVLPIVRCYELTGHRPALIYASRLSRWAFAHDPVLTEEGVITQTAWEGHLHAWMDSMSGIIRCARAGGEGLELTAVVRRARLLYEWVRAYWTTDFGWVADSVGSQTCETDTITSAIRLALELIKNGHPEYCDDVERFVRNQLVENQFRRRESWIDALPFSRGLYGAFESYAAPNTLLAVARGDVEGCCINGGVRGLLLARQSAIFEDASGITINLLFDAASQSLEVVSYLPFEGRLDLYPTSTKVVRLRLPTWLATRAVNVDGPAALRVDTEGQWLRLSAIQPQSHITLRFEQPEREQRYSVAGSEYRATWRGDTVLSIAPGGNPYGIFAPMRFTGAKIGPRESPVQPRVLGVQW